MSSKKKNSRSRSGSRLRSNQQTFIDSLTERIRNEANENIYNFISSSSNELCSIMISYVNGISTEYNAQYPDDDFIGGSASPLAHSSHHSSPQAQASPLASHHSSPQAQASPLASHHSSHHSSPQASHHSSHHSSPQASHHSSPLASHQASHHASALASHQASHHASPEKEESETGQQQPNFEDIFFPIPKNIEKKRPETTNISSIDEDLRKTKTLLFKKKNTLEEAESSQLNKRMDEMMKQIRHLENLLNASVEHLSDQNTETHGLIQGSKNEIIDNMTSGFKRVVTSVESFAGNDYCKFAFSNSNNITPAKRRQYLVYCISQTILSMLLLFLNCVLFVATIFYEFELRILQIVSNAVEFGTAIVPERFRIKFIVEALKIIMMGLVINFQVIAVSLFFEYITGISSFETTRVICEEKLMGYAFKAGHIAYNLNIGNVLLAADIVVPGELLDKMKPTIKILTAFSMFYTSESSAKAIDQFMSFNFTRKALETKQQQKISRKPSMFSSWFRPNDEAISKLIRDIPESELPKFSKPINPSTLNPTNIGKYKQFSTDLTQWKPFEPFNMPRLRTILQPWSLINFNTGWVLFPSLRNFDWWKDTIRAKYIEEVMSKGKIIQDKWTLIHNRLQTAVYDYLKSENAKLLYRSKTYGIYYYALQKTLSIPKLNFADLLLEGANAYEIITSIFHFSYEENPPVARATDHVIRNIDSMIGCLDGAVQIFTQDIDNPQLPIDLDDTEREVEKAKLFIIMHNYLYDNFLASTLTVTDDRFFQNYNKDDPLEIEELKKRQQEQDELFRQLYEKNKNNSFFKTASYLASTVSSGIYDLLFKTDEGFNRAEIIDEMGGGSAKRLSPIVLPRNNPHKMPQNAIASAKTQRPLKPPGTMLTTPTDKIKTGFVTAYTDVFDLFATSITTLLSCAEDIFESDGAIVEEQREDLSILISNRRLLFFIYWNDSINETLSKYQVATAIGDIFIRDVYNHRQTDVSSDKGINGKGIRINNKGRRKSKRINNKGRRKSKKRIYRKYTRRI